MENQTQFTNWQNFIDAEIKLLWQLVNTKDESYRKNMGKPPEMFRVWHLDNADWQEGLCKGRVLDTRVFLAGSFEKSEIGEEYDFGERSEKSAFFQKALIKFCIDEDEKKLLLEYVLGPRYGRGVIYTLHKVVDDFRVDSRCIWMS